MLINLEKWSWIWLESCYRSKIEKFDIHFVNIVSSVSARKLKCSSSARLGTFIARLGSSWKNPARAHHYPLLRIPKINGFCLECNFFLKKCWFEVGQSKFKHPVCSTAQFRRNFHLSHIKYAKKHQSLLSLFLQSTFLTQYWVYNRSLLSSLYN